MTDFDPNFVTLLFPARCVGCESELSSASRDDPVPRKHRSQAVEDPFHYHWCPDCWKQICVAQIERCQKCAAVINGHNPLGDRCALCRELDLRFARASSIGNYRGLLQELVIRMKNQHDEQLAVQLGQILACEIARGDFFDELDLVIPVPTHWWRRFERGFHGAEVLAETVAKSCQLPVSRNLVRCQRSTKKQGTLSTPGRFKNVRHAFGIRSRTNVSGLTILIIDDVMTSGATASELARLLLGAGAAKVYVGVIARGARVS